MKTTNPWQYCHRLCVLLAAYVSVCAKGTYHALSQALLRLAAIRDDAGRQLIDDVCAKFRKEGTTGKDIASYKESDWKRVGFAANKGRHALLQALAKQKQDYAEATEPHHLAAAAEEARVRAAINSAAEIAAFAAEKDKDKLAAQSRLRAALKADAFMYGGSNGLK